MKTFVKAKSDYKDLLIEGKLYEVEHEFESDKTRCGHVVIIDIDDELTCFDADTFFE